MYDELVRQMRACCNGEPCEEANCCFNPKSDLDCIEQLLTKAADAIEELNEQLENETEYATALNSYVPQWIPVSEKLPEIDEKHHCSKDVLAYLKDGGMCFTALEENILGQTWFECERHPALEEEMIVTHWMPLPSPPKEES